MPVKIITTELGHSLPPEAPHNITFHLPTWERGKALRRRDPELLAKLSSIYPRFSPWCEVRQLATLLHPLVSLPPPITHGLILFTHPDAFSTAQRFSSSPNRVGEHRILPADLLFRVVDVPLTLPLPSEPDCPTGGSGEVVRLYAVAYPLARAPGAVGVWQNYGTGVSSRLAAALLPAVEQGRAEVVAFEGDGSGDVSVEKVPAPTHLPLGEAHQGLRKKIAELVGGGGRIGEDDVWLYPTGMAAVHRMHMALVEARGGGTVVLLGSLFANSFQLGKESEWGMKHFARCDDESGVVEELEEWLEGEKQTGRRPAYLFAEFPSNPILVSLDLRRLREVADKYDVPVVIDETIGSFCNIDVSPFADVIITSITKSLSGYANVMGGSVALPASSPHYTALKSTLARQFRNEYFHPDAAKLLSNAADYLPRSAVLNRNAMTLATFLHKYSLSPASPVTRVLYPPFTDTHANYRSVMLAPTPEFTPGYGCLLAVEFASTRVAAVFYDNLSVYHGPHLGAHLTLAFPFNEAIWGADPEVAAYWARADAKPEQVRVSVGLETEEELLDTFEAALRAAEGVYEGGAGGREE